jgi:hypothetical protein
MRPLLLPLFSALLGCALPGDDSAFDVPVTDGDGAVDPGVDADGSVPDFPPADDGTPPDDRAAGDDAAVDDAVGADEASPGEPVCRYECDRDGECAAIHGAGYVCREIFVSITRACLDLCRTDADCRSGAESDPLMVCRDGRCGMRACTGDSECGWVGTDGDCRRVDYGSVRTCVRECRAAADCALGAPFDVLWRCAGGVCTWGCDSDAQCAEVFGSSGYGCREPYVDPGPYCVRSCSSVDDCLTGSPSDAMAECR